MALDAGSDERFLADAERMGKRPPNEGSSIALGDAEMLQFPPYVCGLAERKMASCRAGAAGWGCVSRNNEAVSYAPT